MPGYRAFGDGNFHLKLSDPPEAKVALADLLAFARETQGTDRYTSDATVRRRLGISPVRFATLLVRAINDAEAWKLDPELMRRLRDRRDANRMLRASVKPVGTEPEPEPAGQTSFLDVEEATRRREEAIGRVDAHAEPDVKGALLAAVHDIATERMELTSDDVWVRFRQANEEAPHEPRVLGAVMRIAERQGWIAATAEFRLSARPETHRNPKRVWRSQLA